MRAHALVFASIGLVAACNAGVGSTVGFGGSSANGPGSNGATNGTASGPAGSTSTGFGTSASNGAGGANNGCSAASQLVYVFTTDNEIYSFNPPMKTFTFVAKPDCVANGTPNSMAIDRNLVAWINYIGEVDTFDLTAKTGCKKAMTLPGGYTQIGMGFSTDMPGGTAETLYVDGIGGAGLAKINTTAKTLSPIGGFSSDPNLDGQSCELTGTGSARLFGYFTTAPYVRVAELNKSNASVISDKELTGVPPPQDWAWSFWGGDFYLYASDGINNSSVIQYRPTTGAVNTSYVPDAGFKIVGAGVSTCAPINPPM